MGWQGCPVVEKVVSGPAGGDASLGVWAVGWAHSVGEFGRRASRAKEVAGWATGIVDCGTGVAGRVQVGCGQCWAWLGALGKLVSGWPVEILHRGRTGDR